MIDYDEMITGERREGLYIGLWSIAKKLAAAFGVGVGLLLLGTSGYTPNMKQPDSVVLTLRVLYALVPCVCNLLGFLIALKYPIDQKFHREIRKKIDEGLTGEHETPLSWESLQFLKRIAFMLIKKNVTIELPVEDVFHVCPGFLTTL